MTAYVLSPFARSNSKEVSQYYPEEEFKERWGTIVVASTPVVDQKVLYLMHKRRLYSIEIQLESQKLQEIRKTQVKFPLISAIIEKVKVDTQNQHVHCLIHHRESPREQFKERCMYSLSSGKLINTWADKEYFTFCLDPQGGDVIYFRKSPKNAKPSCMLEKVNALSNVTLCQHDYHQANSELVLFEVGSNNLIYMINRGKRGECPTYVECVDSVTLQWKLNIEIGFPLYSGMFVDDYIFLRVKNDETLYKYDVINRKRTIHCTNFPYWDSYADELDELIPWRDFLVQAFDACFDYLNKLGLLYMFQMRGER